MSEKLKKTNTTITLDDLPVQMSFFAPEPIVRPEHNVGKFAGIIFSSPYSHDLKKELVHSWKIKHGDGDNDLSASLVVAPRLGSKRPTTTTLRVFLALLQVWTSIGKPENGVIKFSARQLASIIGWRWSGKDCANRIEEHVKILTGTSITWTFSFLRSSGERDRLVSDMSLVASADYAERSMLLKEEKFAAVQRVRLNPDLVENMLAGFVRPLNYEALKTIANDTALNLYTRLDLYLSKKTRWERRSLALFQEELGLHGKRYEKRFARHAKLKELVAQLNGVELINGRLKLWIEKTSDGQDHKLVATRSTSTFTEKRKHLKRVNGKEEAMVIATDVIDTIIAQPTGGSPKEGYIVHLCELYPTDLIYQALSVAKADYHGKVKKTLTHVFVYELRRLVRQSKYHTWHKDVKKE